jgi:hypothetical protein
MDKVAHQVRWEDVVKHAFGLFGPAKVVLYALDLRTSGTRPGHVAGLVSNVVELFYDTLNSRTYT